MGVDSPPCCRQVLVVAPSCLLDRCPAATTECSFERTNRNLPATCLDGAELDGLGARGHHYALIGRCVDGGDGARLPCTSCRRWSLRLWLRLVQPPGPAISRASARAHARCQRVDGRVGVRIVPRPRRATKGGRRHRTGRKRRPARPSGHHRRHRRSVAPKRVRPYSLRRPPVTPSRGTVALSTSFLFSLPNSGRAE